MVAVLTLDNRRVFSGIGVLSAGTAIKPMPPNPPNAATRSLRLAGMPPPRSGGVLVEVVGSDIWLPTWGKVVLSPPGFLSSPKKYRFLGMLKIHVSYYIKGNFLQIKKFVP